MTSHVCAQITLHTHKTPSHSSKKSSPLKPVMMDDNTLYTMFSKRRKLVKATKMSTREKGLWLRKSAEKSTSKSDKKEGVKKQLDLINTPQIK